MPLAVRMRADEDADLARLVDAHTRHLVAADLDAEGVEHRGVVRRALDVGADADPEIPAALAAAALSGAKVRVAENVERLLQGFAVTAAFDLGAHDGGVRMLVRGDHVPQPDVGRVQAEFGRGHVQQALHDQHRNRHADPAVHADGRFVGGDRAGLQVVSRNLVRAGQRARGMLGLEGRPPRVGRIPAGVPEKPRAHPADGAVAVQCEFRGHDLMLGVERRGQMFAAVLDPLDGLAEFACEIGDEDFLGERVRLEPEPPAHVRRDHPDAMFGQAQQRRQAGAQGVRHLAGRPDRQRVVRDVVARHAAARLHGHGHVPVGHETVGHDAGRVLKRGADFADPGFEALHDVVAPLVVHERRVRFQGSFHVGDRLQGFVLDLDEFRGVFRNVAVGRDDRGDHVADKAHLVVGQHAPVARLVGRHLVRIELDAQRGDRVQHVMTGQHAPHPGQSRGRLDVDRPDPGVGIRTADEGDRQHVGQVQVVDVLRAAQQHARIFDPAHFGAQHLPGPLAAHAECSHSLSSGRPAIVRPRPSSGRSMPGRAPA